MSGLDGTPGGDPGERLRLARERKGLGLEQVAESLRLETGTVQALERGDYARIGAAVFVRGFLRRYAELVGDAAVRDAVFPRIVAEHERSVRHCLAITQQSRLLEDNPTLERSMRNRFPYLDPLNHLQVELLRRYRAGDTDRRTRGAIHLTINGLAAGLRNSG